MTTGRDVFRQMLRDAREVRKQRERAARAERLYRRSLANRRTGKDKA